MKEDRTSDVKIEANCARYVDEHFLKLLKNTRFERVTDEEGQFRGEDLILTLKDGKRMIIDEKAKVKGLINKVIAYPSFELITKTTSGKSWVKGWFIKPETTTTHYAFISIATDKPVASHHEDEVSDKDISAMVYSIIDKIALRRWIENETGLTMAEIENDAWKLRDTYMNGGWQEVIPYKRDELGNYIYIKMSKQLPKKPINLIVRRDYLRKNNLIKEIYIDPKGRPSHYDAPAEFTKDEILKPL